MKPLDLILDTDLGSDCDDAMALAYLAYAARRGEITLRAVTVSNGCPDAQEATRILLRSFGVTPPYVSRAPETARTYDRYCEELVRRFGREGDPIPEEDAVRVLRRALLESDGAILVGIGPFTNLAALLESKGDDLSALDGRALVKDRCREIVLMGGTFSERSAEKPPEWNAKLDPAATGTVLETSPVDVTVLPFEVGVDMLTGGNVMRRYEESTPLSLAFCRFPKTREMGGRHSWDPATVLYAVEGCRDFFVESPRGRFTVDGEGRTFFGADPTGLCRYVMLNTDGCAEGEQKARVAAYLDECVLALLEEI